MENLIAGGWTHGGLEIVVEWHESVFRFRVLRPGTLGAVAEGYAVSLEAARQKAVRAAEVAAAVALPLPD